MSNHDDSDAASSSSTSRFITSGVANIVYDTEGPTTFDHENESDNSSVETGISWHTSADFHDIRDDVLMIATTVIWPGANEDDLEVDRIPQSEWWIIVAVKYDDQEVIVRTSKPGEDTDVKKVLASARFANQKVRMPVPRVISVDLTPNNPLGRPYVVQEKINDNKVFLAYQDMSHLDKCQIARELGTYARKMLATSSSIAGNINVPDGVADTKFHVQESPAADETLELAPSDGLSNRPFSELELEVEDIGAKESVLDFMIRMLAEQNVLYLEEGDGSENEGSEDEDSEVSSRRLSFRFQTGEFFETFVKITRWLDEQGYLESDRFSLSCECSIDQTLFSAFQLSFNSTLSVG